MHIYLYKSGPWGLGHWWHSGTPTRDRHLFRMLRMTFRTEILWVGPEAQNGNETGQKSSPKVGTVDPMCVLFLKGATLSWIHYQPCQIIFGLGDLRLRFSEPVLGVSQDHWLVGKTPRHNHHRSRACGGRDLLRDENPFGPRCLWASSPLKAAGVHAGALFLLDVMRIVIFILVQYIYIYVYIQCVYMYIYIYICKGLCITYIYIFMCTNQHISFHI